MVRCGDYNLSRITIDDTYLEEIDFEIGFCTIILGLLLVEQGMERQRSSTDNNEVYIGHPQSFPDSDNTSRRSEHTGH